MRHVLLLLLLAAAASQAAMLVEATCSRAWATYELQPGVVVWGSGGSQSAVLDGAGSASASCASAFGGDNPSAVLPIRADLRIDSGSAKASIPWTGMVAEPQGPCPDGSPCHNPVDDYDTMADVSIGGVLVASTPGPIRQGWLNLSGSGGACDFMGCSPLSVAVAGHPVLLPDCGFIDCIEDVRTQPAIQVTLGLPFVIEISGLRGHAHLYRGGNGFFMSELDARWRFTELDGSPVPVAFLPTPEPATFLPGGAALLAGALMATRRRTERPVE